MTGSRDDLMTLQGPMTEKTELGFCFEDQDSSMQSVVVY